MFLTAVYDPSDGPPVDFVEILNPSFPYDYSFTVDSGTYWVGSYVDVGADDPTGAGPEDPDDQIGPLLLPPGGADGGDLTLTLGS